MATVTVRLVRSFEYRNMKAIVLRDVDLDISIEEFKVLITAEIKKSSILPPPFKTFAYDTLKIEYKAHGSKTSDPLINTTDDDKLMLNPEKSLRKNGIEHETEISYFKKEDYLKYKANKEIKW
ncbi:UPF0538 protein C2orf76 homolog [Dendronephthya gigantea]|uniref:UPF0538 protein C2orf76 homolog n=1 Tax=Dendronephthya gigantea TaxID=151771 RepID=UPI00106C203A|nr:UPF0538 protein C2orf76 homolog [Dendronephthya gigantea]